MTGELTNNQTASLKVLASVMLYVGRRVAKSIPQILVCNIKKIKRKKLMFFFLNRLCHMNGKLHYIVMQILNQLFNNRKSNQLLQHVKYIIYISFYYYTYFFFYLIKLSLRVWCEEYIRRIDASFGKELRT
jgi:hypothetical protein